MAIPHNLTQLKKFFAPGMRFRRLNSWSGPLAEWAQICVVDKVQGNGLYVRIEENRRLWIEWEGRAKSYVFTEKGFSIKICDGYLNFEYIDTEKPELQPSEPKPPKANPNLFTGPDAVQKAKQKARFGHKDWLYYRDKSGQLVAEKLTPDSVKRALLAIGTQGRFTEIAASTAQGYSHCWNSGINRLSHARYIEKHGPLW